MLGHAKVGIHRTLSIGCHQDDTAPRFGLFRLGREGRLVDRALRPEVMRDDRAKLVVFHLADVSRRSAKRRDDGNCIGRRPSRDFLRWSDASVQIDGAVHVDQLHDALLDPGICQKAVIAARQHVDHRVPDADHVKRLVHSVLSSNWQNSRIRHALHLGLRATQV